jgi:hypothetical protein
MRDIREWHENGGVTNCTFIHLGMFNSFQKERGKTVRALSPADSSIGCRKRCGTVMMYNVDRSIVHRERPEQVVLVAERKARTHASVAFQRERKLHQRTSGTLASTPHEANSFFIQIRDRVPAMPRTSTTDIYVGRLHAVGGGRRRSGLEWSRRVRRSVEWCTEVLSIDLQQWVSRNVVKRRTW